MQCSQLAKAFGVVDLITLNKVPGEAGVKLAPKVAKDQR